MKVLLLIVSTLFICQHAIAQDRYNQAVTVFNNFKDAVAKKDAETALKYVDEKTLDWVGDIAQMAATVSRDELRAAPILQQYMILTVRHFTQGKDLRTINQKELFSIMIRQGILANYVTLMQAGTLKSPQEEGEIRISIMLGNDEGMYEWVISPDAPVLVDFRTILSNCDQLITVDHEVSEKPADTYLELLFKKYFNENIKATDWEPAK